MNVRALGCGTLAVVVFVLIGLIGIWRAGAPAECPGLLPYDAGTYEPVGTPMPEPRLTELDEPMENAGSVPFGLASWAVYVQPGTAPTASGIPLPQRIVLDCRDGTFQAYQRGAR